MHIIKHFITITHHRHLVIRHAFKVGIGFRGLFHDLSKYSFVEFFNGAKYYKGDMSPTEYERMDIGYSKAWLHHKGRNKHHLEYWFDISNVSHKYEAVEMPIKYLKEMFCDRIAASKTYLKKEYKDSSPYDYFMTHQGKALMNIKSASLMEEWLYMLKSLQKLFQLF